MTRIIAIASQKGGVGKTTTSIELASGLARKGHRVLLIDMDSQANSSKVLLANYQELTKDETVFTTILQRKPLNVRPTAVPRLDISPAHILLSNTDVELTLAKDHREERLKRELDQVKDQYAYVIIDCPPALSWLTLNAFTAADGVIVVVAPGYFELDSIMQISKTIDEVREYYNAHLELIGLLFNMSDPTLNSTTSLQILREDYSDVLLKTIIPRNTDLRDAHFNKMDIYAFNPASKGAIAYSKLIEELADGEKTQ